VIDFLFDALPDWMIIALIWLTPSIALGVLLAVVAVINRARHRRYQRVADESTAEIRALEALLAAAPFDGGGRDDVDEGSSH